MPHRVLVLGNTGMLGHMVEHVLAADGRFDVSSVGRAELDVMGFVSGAGGKTPEVEEARSAGRTSGVKEPASMLRSPRPKRRESARPSLHVLLISADYIINCIGLTARHIDDADPASVARTIRVNAEFPHTLAMAAVARGVRVIHMSTDGVFSGQSLGPYAEDAVPDATDTYGRTKLLGESRASNVLNIRTSIIGPSPVKREGLWEWVASQPDGATVDGYTNHFWHGVTTRQFAEFCAQVMAEDRFGALRERGHILHVTPNAPVTKVELVKHIAAALGKQITVRPIANAQSIHRVLAMRPDVAAMFSAAQSITEALRTCVTARA